MRPARLLEPLRGRQLRRRARDLAVMATPSGLVHLARHRRAQRRRREDRGEIEGAFEVSWVDVDDACRIAVFWSEVPGVGSGPSASVYVHDSEVLRLDCFGGHRGHMHLNPEQVTARGGPSDPRIYFEAGGRRGHVRRARFELSRNIDAALAANDLGRVRRHVLDADRLRGAASDMADAMTALIDTREGASSPVEVPPDTP